MKRWCKALTNGYGFSPVLANPHYKQTASDANPVPSLTCTTQKETALSINSVLLVWYTWVMSLK